MPRSEVARARSAAPRLTATLARVRARARARAASLRRRCRRRPKSCHSRLAHSSHAWPLSSLQAGITNRCGARPDAPKHWFKRYVWYVDEQCAIPNPVFAAGNAASTRFFSLPSLLVSYPRWRDYRATELPDSHFAARTSPSHHKITPTTLKNKARASPAPNQAVGGGAAADTLPLWPKTTHSGRQPTHRCGRPRRSHEDLAQRQWLYTARPRK